MKVLIIKMSSMGDVIHTLPAINDAARAFPNIQFDWVVEKSFSDIPKWSTHVQRVIPIQLRQWRKNWRKARASDEYLEFKKNIQTTQYDLIIDAQGLFKSAFIAKLAHGPIAGLNFKSAREKFASLFYQKKYAVKKDQHAITRLRQLFAAALNYPCPTTTPDYGINRASLPPKPIAINENYLIFLHGTTWASKHYPEKYWHELIAQHAQTKILLPWGNEVEKQRAERLAALHANAVVLPKCSIAQMASLLADAKCIIAVDTGLGHLAAALNTPTISLYGPTNPIEVGTLGANQIHLTANFACAPCKQRQCTYKKPSAVTPACFTSLPPTHIKEYL